LEVVGVADAMFAVYLSHEQPSLTFAQYPNNLTFREFRLPPMFKEMEVSIFNLFTIRVSLLKNICTGKPAMCTARIGLLTISHQPPVTGRRSKSTSSNKVFRFFVIRQQEVYQFDAYGHFRLQNI
jgi:hypothetical protein